MRFSMCYLMHVTTKINPRSSLKSLAIISTVLFTRAINTHISTRGSVLPFFAFAMTLQRSSPPASPAPRSASAAAAAEGRPRHPRPALRRRRPRCRAPWRRPTRPPRQRGRRAPSLPRRHRAAPAAPRNAPGVCSRAAVPAVAPGERVRLTAGLR